MGQLNHITPNMVPRPTGAARQDLEAVYRYLFGLAGDLEYRFAEIERRLNDLEKGSKRAKTTSRAQTE